jgi:RNA polymerase sigma-70 factor (ECF subfamily)
MNSFGEFIPTRHSLLSRLKDWNESWRVFFDTYWKLIYHAAVKAGLSDAEAQDVVQDTVISVMKSMPNFQYDPKKGSFKHWLLQLTKWRIADQLRKRQWGGEHQRHDGSTSTETVTAERVANPESSELDLIWDQEWENNLMDAAIERVKKKVDPKQYQIFDLYVLKKWSVLKVAKTLKVNPGIVYLIKHRITKLIKKEVSCLQSNTTP